MGKIYNCENSSSLFKPLTFKNVKKGINLYHKVSYFKSNNLEKHPLNANNLVLNFPKSCWLFYLLLLFSGITTGQSIYTNPITGSNPNSSNPYTTGQILNDNINGSGISRGSGIIGQNANNTYRASGWNSGSIDLNDFYQFTLTPNSCNAINFTSLVFNYSISSGNLSIALRSSLDNYGNNISTSSITGTAASTISLSGAVFQNINSAITFRLYGWNASNSSRTFSINDFTFNGTVVSNTPSFTTQPISSSVFCQNTSPTALTVAATLGGGTFLSYQWFRNTVASSAGGTSISGANWLSYNPPGNVAGTFYYYCIVTNSIGCENRSNVATINITEQPSGNFSYSSAGFCNSTSSLQTVTSNFLGAPGTYSSTAGLSLNAATGAISPSLSTPNSSSYLVTYAVTASGGCNAYSTTTNVTIDAEGTGTISYPTAPFCKSSSTPVTPIITGAGGSGNSTWVLGAPFGLAINGSGTITPSTSNAGTYVVTYFRAASAYCPEYSSNTNITINNIPTVASTTPASNCANNFVTLGATANNGTINWYAASTGGNTIVTGNSFSTPTLSSTTTYFAASENAGCGASARTAVVATINPLPTITSTTAASRCGNGFVTLSAVSSSTINWFNAASGGTSLGTGATFITPTLSNTTTYFAEASNGGCVSPRTAVIATINSIPTITSTTAGSRCNPGTVSLAAATSIGTINWYTSLTGGTLITTGTSYTTPSISSATTYFIDASSNGCTTSSRTPIIATVTPFPTISATTPGSNCGTGIVILGATPSAGTINWYSASTGGAAIGNGVSFTTPSISASTTYFAEANNNGCISATRTSVLATIHPVPSITGTTAANRCGAGTLTLNATASSGTIQWFNTPTGGTALGSGASFTTTSISTTTTYYVQTISAAGCPSPRTAVIATIKPIPTLSISPNYCSDGGLVVLSATPGLASYVWNNLSTTQIIEVDIAGEYSVTATNIQGCSAFASIFVAEEKVLNGDFNDGNTGFITNYTFKPDLVSVTDELWVEGTYAIVPNANTVHPHFNGKDRFFGTGNMMVLNGSPALGATVWSQNNISVLPNTTYYFSAWAMSVVNGNNATLQFSINGGQIGTIAFLPNGYTNNSGPYTWVRFYGQWNSGPSTSANLSIVNLNTVLGGNDFAMDDISFGTLSPIELFINPTANSGSAVCANGELYLTANAEGGASPFVYSWSGPNGFTSTAANPTVTSSASAIHNGTYTLTLTDGFGCTKTQSTTVAISSLPNNQTISAVVPSICSGNSTFIQLASSEIGVGYQLRNNLNDDLIGNEIQGTGTVIQLPTGTLNSNTTFNVIATKYSTGCDVELTNTITVNVSVTPILNITNQAACSGTVNLTAPSVIAGSIGTGTLSYWTNAAGTTALVNPSAVSTSGTYYIRRTNGSCADIKPVVVTISTTPVATFNYTGSPFCSNGIDPTAIFSGSATPGIFSSTTGLVFSNVSTGTIDLSASNPGTYTITNTITPSGSCASVSATRSITITAAPNPNFSYISNDLCQSPNAANANPLFESGATAGTFSSSSGLNFVSTSTGVLNITASTPGNYAVVNLLPATSGCSAASDTFYLDINPYTLSGAISASSSDDIICEGEIVDLYASGTSYQTVLLRENFNGSFTNWTTSNSSTGGTTANSAWTLRADNYSYSSNNFRSNDQTQFYLTNSQSQGSSGTTNTALRSPMLNTIGFTNLSLDFFQYFNFRNSGDVAKVQVSTNNTTWTDVATYTSNQGTLTGFKNSVVNLNAYIGLPSFYVRFIYQATNDRYWAIDNVSITGASNRYTYSWASSPSGFISSQQNPQDLTPDLSKFYVASAMNSYGCEVTATPVPITVNPKPTDNAGVDKTICGTGGVMIGESPVIGRTYTWSPATALNNPGIANPIASPTLQTTYTLTETISETGCFSTSSAVVSLNATPAISETSSGFRCNSGTVTISAVSSTGIVKWYASLTGGTLLGTGETFTTPSISTTTTYYADPSTAGCAVGARTAVIASIFTPPTITSQVTPTASYSQNITANPLSLIANAGSGTIESYQWYSSPTASNAAGTIIFGATTASFIPPTSVVGTIYYYCLVTNSNGCSVKSNISGAIITLLSPIITSVIPTLPLISDQLENTGYRGQRITINGNNFMSNSIVSFNGTVATSFVFVNSNQITAIVNNTGANSSANVVVTNPGNGAFGTAIFNYIGYITNETGDWNTNATWLGNTLPLLGSDATIAFANTSNTAVSALLRQITIRPSATLTMGGAASSLTTSDLLLYGNLIWTSTGNLSIAGRFNLGPDAVFTPSNGSVTFNGLVNQTLFNGTNFLEFNIINLAGTGTKGLNAASIVRAKNLNIQSGAGFAPGTNSQNVILTGNLLVNGNLEPGNSEFSFTGNGTQDISLIGAGNIVFSKLNIDKSAGAITLSNNVQVTDTFKLKSGIINTQTYTLEIGSSTNSPGVITYTNGLVAGKLKRWFPATTNLGTATGLFPLGQFVNNSWKMRNAQINFTSAPSAGGHLTAEFVALPMINGTLGSQDFITQTSSGGAGFTITNFSNDGYWKIENQTNTLVDGQFTISLTGEGFSMPNGLTQVTIAKRITGGNWSTPGNHQQPEGSTSLPTLKRGAIIGFGNFGFAAGENNALPITLISFDANCHESEIKVDWSTASESNNKEFLIEESKDAINWKMLKKFQGAGNSNTIKFYSEKVTPSINNGCYIRLKQIDYNGDSEAFDPIFINCEKQKETYLKIYPNPAIDYTTVEINAEEELEVLLTLFNANGQILFSQKMNLNAGITAAKLDISNLPSGNYYLNASNDKHIKIEGSKTIIKR